jgi:hypothetical protein
VEPGSLFAGLVAPDLFTRSVNRVAGRVVERRRLASNVRDRTGIRPGRAWRRWLAQERNWDAIVTEAAGAYDELVADLAAELAAAQCRRWMRRPASPQVLGERAQQLVRATIEGIVESLDPSRAVATSGARIQQDVERVHRAISEVGREVRAGLGTDERTRDALAGLPPPAAVTVRALLDDRQPAGARLLEQLAGGRDALEVVRGLLASPPEWLREASANAWEALADFAQAHRQAPLAADLLLQAADIAPDRWRLLLRASLAAAQAEDVPRAHDLLGRAHQLGADLVLVRVLRAALAEDYAGITEIGLPQVEGEVWACALLVKAVRRWTGPSAALVLAEQVVVRHPEAATLRLTTAQLLLEIIHCTPGLAPRNALTRAVDLAVQVRDERRRWDGDSSAAVAVACDAALAAGDDALVLRLGRTPPAGEASPVEAGHADVAVLVAHAAAMVGDVPALEEALAVVASVGSPFDLALLSGYLLRHKQAPNNAVIAAYREALGLARTAEQRVRAKVVLASCGVPGDVPDEDGDLQEEDDNRQGGDHATDDRAASVAEGGAVSGPGHDARLRNAALVEAARAEAHDDHQGAIEALRPWAARSISAAELLAESYRRNGEPRAAARVLVDSANRFRSPHLLPRAAAVLAEAGLPDDAEQVALDALSSGGLSSGPLRDIHVLLIHRAEERRDWSLLRTRVEAAREDLPDDAPLQWALVAALVNEQRFEQAWRELIRPPVLAPARPQDATIAMQLTSLFLTGAARSRALLDLLDRFPDDTDVQVTAILSFFGDDHDGVPNEETARWRDLIARFVAEHPQHPAFYAIDLPDDPAEMVKVLLDHIPPRPPAVDELAQAIAAGRIPYGMLAAASRRPYLVALLHRAAGCLPIATVEPAVAQAELDNARAALDGAVVIDMSVIVSTLAVPDLWQLVLTLFEALHSTFDARADAVAAKLDVDWPATGAFGRDATDQFVYVEHDPSVLQETRCRAAVAVQAMDHLSVTHHRIRHPQLVEAGWTDDRWFTPWVGPMDMAVARGLPFLCDDLGLRALARALGVPTFGTVALLSLLEEIGRVRPQQARRWRQSLRAEYCVDLPFDVADLVELAQARQWRPGPAAMALARPAAWQDPYAALRLVNHAFAELANDSTAAAQWLYAAVVGFGTGRPAAAVQDIARALLFSAFAMASGGPVAFSPLLQAARAACDHVGSPGFLEGTVSDLMARLTAQHSVDIALRLVVHLLSELPDPDRRVALQRLVAAS